MSVFIDTARRLQGYPGDIRARAPVAAGHRNAFEIRSVFPMKRIGIFLRRMFMAAPMKKRVRPLSKEVRVAIMRKDDTVRLIHETRRQFNITR